MPLTESYDRADANTEAGAKILPVPVVMAPRVSRAVMLTKLFSWLTAMLLAAAVLISLISITSERNDLRAQLSEQSTELQCRSAAAFSVNRAVGIRDNYIAEALVKVANDDRDGLLAIIGPLQTATDDVNTALQAQAVALKACTKG